MFFVVEVILSLFWNVISLHEWSFCHATAFSVVEIKEESRQVCYKMFYYINHNEKLLKYYLPVRRLQKSRLTSRLMYLVQNSFCWTWGSNLRAQALQAPWGAETEDQIWEVLTPDFHRLSSVISNLKRNFKKYCIHI